MTAWRPGQTTADPSSLETSETADLLESFGQGQLASQEFWRRYERPGVAARADLDTRREEQALDQERQVFERRMEQDKRLFTITTAMGWTAFVVLLLFNIYAAAGKTGLASPFPEISMGLAWSQSIGVSVRLWMLHGKRGTGELQPTTPRPGSDAV